MVVFGKIRNFWTSGVLDSADIALGGATVLTSDSIDSPPDVSTNLTPRHSLK